MTQDEEMDLLSRIGQTVPRSGGLVCRPPDPLAEAQRTLDAMAAQRKADGPPVTRAEYDDLVRRVERIERDRDLRAFPTPDEIDSHLAMTESDEVRGIVAKIRAALEAGKREVLVEWSSRDVMRAVSDIVQANGWGVIWHSESGRGSRVEVVA